MARPQGRKSERVLTTRPSGLLYPCLCRGPAGETEVQRLSLPIVSKGVFKLSQHLLNKHIWWYTFIRETIMPVTWNRLLFSGKLFFKMNFWALFIRKNYFKITLKAFILRHKKNLVSNWRETFNDDQSRTGEVGGEQIVSGRNKLTFYCNVTQTRSR